MCTSSSALTCLPMVQWTPYFFMWLRNYLFSFFPKTKTFQSFPTISGKFLGRDHEVLSIHLYSVFCFVVFSKATDLWTTFPRLHCVQCSQLIGLLPSRLLVQHLKRKETEDSLFLVSHKLWVLQGWILQQSVFICYLPVTGVCQNYELAIGFWPPHNNFWLCPQLSNLWSSNSLFYIFPVLSMYNGFYIFNLIISTLYVI